MDYKSGYTIFSFLLFLIFYREVFLITKSKNTNVGYCYSDAILLYKQSVISGI